MTEEDWLADSASSEHLEAMLAQVLAGTTRRKLRLFLAACATHDKFRENREFIEAGNIEEGLTRLEQQVKENPNDVELRNYFLRHRTVEVQSWDTSRQSMLKLPWEGKGFHLGHGNRFVDGNNSRFVDGSSNQQRFVLFESDRLASLARSRSYVGVA